MKLKAGTPITLDVRTRLLVMLAVLSLPLLIISLIQLHSYQKSLNEQTATIARIETAAAAGALEAWVEDHSAALAGGVGGVSPSEANALYERVRRQATAGNEAVIGIFDARGRLLPRGISETAVPEKLVAGVEQQRWSDGVTRVTGLARAQPSGWNVAVGVPLPENTPAGRAIVILTTTWALMLLGSFFLAIWAVGRFTKPLRELAASASMLGEGKLKERVEVETDDEVGTLAGSFNSMAASLETKFEQVQKQSAFIGEVLDSLPLGVVVLDASLIVRKVNAAFAGMAGRSAASLTGRGLYEAAAGLAVLSEIVEDVRCTRRAFVNYSLPLDLVARTRNAAGNRPEEAQKFWDIILWPVTDRSEGRGDLILILSEVSKRVRAERLATAAFASEKARAAELESVINQMDEGVVIVDAQGRCRVNPSAARIIGHKPDELREGVHALIADMALRDRNGRVLEPSETAINRALEKGEHVSGEQCKIVRDDGEERVLAVGAIPLAGEGGRTVGVVVVFRDITEEVSSHNELVEAYDRLREHDRLKSAFVASMSHELRTPLNVIIGLCQLLERDPQLPLAPLQNEAVLRMERNARSLLDLVNDMLDYSRLEAGRSALRLETVDVAGVIGEAVETYADVARDKNIRIDVAVSPEVGTVCTDKHKLTQVLSSLISNAVKFTARGAVVVGAGASGPDRWYVEVTDTGIGMSSDALTYIFDGFRQVDDQLTRSYSGVGLGLAITRKIVELLEGEITVESKQNEGSRFRIVWPRESPPRTGTGSLISPHASPVDAVNRHVRVV